jgi:hypothetical protein
MKNLFFTIIFLSWFASRSQEVPCPPTGVTTDPTNPQNPITGHTDFINWFDWTNSDYRTLYDNDNTGYIRNPYFARAGATSTFYDNPDYKPEDGWELVSFNLGLDKDGNLDPERIGQAYFILYNKYRSILRVFVAIEQDQPGNIIDIELRFADVAYKTALFASLDEVQQPLKSFDPFILASSSQAFVNTPDFRDWNYADFPVSYDPCSCIRTTEEDNETVDLGDSEFLLNVKVVNKADIFLEGTSNGTLKPLEKDPNQTNGTDNWNSFYGPVKRLGNSVKAGKKAYKTFSGFKSDVSSEAGAGKASTGFDNVAKFLTKEIPVLEAVPYVSEALAIVDFFVTGGKKEDATKIGPMAMNLEHSFSGEIRTAHDYILDNRIFTPGSEFTPDPVSTDPNRPLGDARYPLYNEILGVFTLLEKPEVKVWRGTLDEEFPDSDELETGYSHNFIFRKAVKITPGSIKIAVNPASGLSIKESYIQLNYLLAEQGPRDRVALYDAVEKRTYQGKSLSSQLIPLQNLDERAVLFDIVHVKHPRTFQNEDNSLRAYQDGTLTTSLVIVLENDQGAQFLHKSTWDTDIIEVLNDNEHYWDWKESNFSANGVSPPTSDAWPFPGGDYGFYGAPESIDFLSEPWRPNGNIPFTVPVMNSFKPLTFKARDNISLENIATGGALYQAPILNALRKSDVFIAGTAINVENTLLDANTTLQISPLGIANQTALNTANIATAEEVNLICESSTYLGSKRVNYKQENYLQDKPIATREELNFLTYPNPAQENVLILLENVASYPTELRVALVDVSGNPVRQTTVKSTELNGNKYPLDLQGLAPGMYVVRVNAENVSGQQKIVKM